MSFCPKCGREIIDETFGCPVCAFQKEDENTQTENTNHTDINQPYQGGAGNTNSNQPYQGGAGNTNGNQPYQGGAGNTNSNQYYQGGTWNQPNYQNNQMQQTNYIQTPIKVMSIALIILTGGIGAIVSLVCGIIMMKNDVEEYRKFGQVITIVSAAMLAILFLCCVLGVFGEMMDQYVYF